MGKKGEEATALFYQGYNCSQSVAGAFAEETGLSQQLLLRLSVGLGGGVGRLREVCGAFGGAVLVLGLLYGDGSPASKRTVYPIVQQLAAQYRQANGGGSIVCRELLGLTRPEGSPVPEARTPEYYKKRPCPALVCCAADLLADYIAQHPPRRDPPPEDGAAQTETP